MRQSITLLRKVRRESIVTLLTQKAVVIDAGTTVVVGIRPVSATDLMSPAEPGAACKLMVPSAGKAVKVSLKRAAQKC